MSELVDKDFRNRCFDGDPSRGKNDHRDVYQRDRARIIHSAAFRRLQGKTQVMGVGEGDFHRTRLTHSIEAGQIGEGLVHQLLKKYKKKKKLSRWLPGMELISAACYAHDIGHPPFGHAGEKALYKKMINSGGFEGNGQTLRILTKLEKRIENQGINPTLRLVLAVLKYPIAYSKFDLSKHKDHPPKCYFDSESEIVEKAISFFDPADKRKFCSEFSKENGRSKPKHRTLDATIMELADDIAYAVHDLEDIVARKFVVWKDLEKFLNKYDVMTATRQKISISHFRKGLFEQGSCGRKKFIGDLVHLFITAVKIEEFDFKHPLLRYRATLPKITHDLLQSLKSMTYELVVKHAAIKQLEYRGERIIGSLFDAMVSNPNELIPVDAQGVLDRKDINRFVCDYIAGMTDDYAEKIYRRLFIPGFGSSRDEL